MWQFDRRRFLGSSLGLAAGLGIGTAAPGHASGGARRAEDLFELVSEMNAFGPRFPGNTAHARYLDWLQDHLERLGFSVRRYPVGLAGWWTRNWSLRITDATGQSERIPVAYYRPHSGQTGPEGVAGELVDLGAAKDLDYLRANATGKIVVADLTTPSVPAGILSPVIDYFEPPAQLPGVLTEDFTRIAFNIGLQNIPDLKLAKRHGAIGMLNIIDMPPEEAAGQYYFHQQTLDGLPALHLDAEQGKRLRERMWHGPITANLVLEADRGPTTIEFLLAELPGNGGKPGAAVLATHSDGQNAVEENGGPAILDMARHFAALPREQRARDLVCFFAPNHMTAYESSPHSSEFLKQHPDFAARVNSALFIEHLGAMNWENNRITGSYGPTGRTEIGAMAVGNSPQLHDTAIKELRASKLERTAVIRPLGNTLYGEAIDFFRAGLPTAGFISAPTYLVQVAEDGHLNKLSPSRLRQQTDYLTRVAAGMLNF